MNAPNDRCWCGEPMVEVEPGFWDCAYQARQEALLTKLIGRVVHSEAFAQSAGLTAQRDPGEAKEPQ